MLMRGCRIEISLPCLLGALGLEYTNDISLYNVLPNQAYNTLTLFLSSPDHPEMPELDEAQDFPKAIIEAHHIESRIKLINAK
jgi:hypothetical protein